MEIEKWVKPNILNLKGYSSAREESAFRNGVFLDANESPFETGLNRYPESVDSRLVNLAAKVWDVSNDRVLLSSGSDEALDWIYKTCCTPGDTVIVCTPAYGMYRVLADIYDCCVVEVPLDSDFQPNVEQILAYSSASILFLNTPNNPIGSDIEPAVVQELIENFGGLIVIDEAYVEFSIRPSYSQLNFPNLLVIRTFSKAWGLAGIRLGGVIASPEWISLFTKVKLPYNLSSLVVNRALEKLNDEESVKSNIRLTIVERERMKEALSEKKDVESIYPSSANFLTVCTPLANEKYTALANRGITVRNRSGYDGLPNCLRVTIGTSEENQKLLEAWEEC